MSMIGIKITALKEAIVGIALKNSGKVKVRKSDLRGIAGLTPYEFQTVFPYLKYRDPIGKFIEDNRHYVIIDCDGIRRVIKNENMEVEE